VGALVSDASRANWKAKMLERKAAGLCVRCGEPNDGTSMCARHHAEYNDRVAASRRRGPRARTIAGKRLTHEELAAARRLEHRLEHIDDPDRPRTRGDCAGGERPCPYVSCKYSLYLDVNPETGAIKLNFPDLEPWELEESCALDVADWGGITLEEVGALTNLVRERIRQVEVKALHQLYRAGFQLGDAPVRRRRA
jgi:hypothetical protein